ncbi:MAG: type II toxin-antitoxin system PemK/MazF family toxin [Anaerolineaceae bacterium]
MEVSKMAVNRGDIFWVRVGGPGQEEPDYAHPCVVIQEDVFNHSRVNTVVVCALTSNLRQAKGPGNVRLEAGEGNLSKSSVAEVSKVSSVEKDRMGECIGKLSPERVEQILAGMRFLQRSTGQDS